MLCVRVFKTPLSHVLDVRGCRHGLWLPATTSFSALFVGYVVVILSGCEKDRRHGAKDDVDMSLCERGPRLVLWV